MKKISRAVVYYTDGTYQELNKPSRSFNVGDIHGGSTIKSAMIYYDDNTYDHIAKYPLPTGDTTALQHETYSDTKQLLNG
jgi:hypothetical protein